MEFNYIHRVQIYASGKTVWNYSVGGRGERLRQLSKLGKGYSWGLVLVIL